MAKRGQKVDVARTKAEAAARLGVSVRTITNWSRHPAFPDCSRGYPIPDLLEFKRLFKSGRGDPNLERAARLKAISEARIKLADARRKEREEQVARGRLVDRDVVLDAITGAIAVARDGLMRRVPRELAALVPRKQRQEFLAAAEERVARILDEFASLVESALTDGGQTKDSVS